MKFPDRSSHRIYVEPQGRNSRLLYINGLSTSLSEEAQIQMIRSLPGFDRANIAVFGYAVEYSYFDFGEIENTLRLRRCENVFAAGQICGTSGYEEAGALGLLAGANAARTVMEEDAVVPERENSYIGVMVDDITGRGVDVPYRLFSSRSENRLHLRQDNADRRLFELGSRLGVLSGPRIRLQRARDEEAMKIRNILENEIMEGTSAAKICRRPEIQIQELLSLLPRLQDLRTDIVQSVMLDEKYGGYIERNLRRSAAVKRASGVSLAEIEDFEGISEICWEAREILERERPGTIAEAGRIPGIRPSDLEGLILHLGKKRSTWNNSAEKTDR